MKTKRIYITLTTIPPRIIDPLFKQHMIHLLKQNIIIQKIFINIPIQYKNFEFTLDCQLILDSIIQTSNLFEIIHLEKDYGPASKLLGPIIYKYSMIENNILIIIDDDRFYHENMSFIYHQFFELNPLILAVTGNQNLYFCLDSYLNCKSVSYFQSKTQYMAAFMSCALMMNPVYQSVLDYFFYILKELPDSFYHDEGILLNYLKFNKINVYNINFQFINVIEKEMSNALVESNHVNRRYIENEIRRLTNQSNYFHRKISKLQFFNPK